MTEVTARSASEFGVPAWRSALRTGPRPFVILLAGLVLLGVLGLLDMMYGSVTLSPREVWSGLTSESDVFAHSVVWQIRYPRFLDGMMVGAALAVSGAMLQGVTRNPLADPTILGVTAAAGLAGRHLLRGCEKPPREQRQQLHHVHREQSVDHQSRQPDCHAVLNGVSANLHPPDCFRR